MNFKKTALAVALLCATSANAATTSVACGSLSCYSQSIWPGRTAQNAPSNNAISPLGSGKHYVLLPSTNTRPYLVIFLPGSTATPSDYKTIAQQAAGNGYGVISLAYPNDVIIGKDALVQSFGGCPDQTNPDSCYEQTRGEVIFGNGVLYATGMNTYTSSPLLTGNNNVTLGDSIVNRIVCVLDYLSTTAISDAPDDNPSVSPAYWSQFLIKGSAANGSPYTTPSSSYATQAYPDWSKIIIAGHSQGGGHAAFMAMRLPVAVHRAVLFSSPQDNVNGTPASWITQPSTTPMGSFWGLCNSGVSTSAPPNDTCAAENDYGNKVTSNWASMGLGTSAQYPAQPMTNIADGSVSPDTGRHRLYITIPYTPSQTTAKNHNSTAVDSAIQSSIYPAWQYLFTGGGTSQ